VITYNHLNLVARVTAANDEQLIYTYDATGRKLSQDLLDMPLTGGLTSKKSSHYLGEFFYENDTLKFINTEEGRVIMTDTVPEYQYHLKDHLGNVRLTFTTKDEVDESLATLETANASQEQSKFLYYNEAVKINYAIYDHTNAGGTYYATRLTGGSTNEKFGLTKTLSVMPGDKISMEVYAKYLDPNSSNWTTAQSNFVASIVGGTAPAGTFVDGGAAGSIGGGTYPISGINHSGETGTAPKAYLNYIVFNKDMTTVLDMGFKRITTNSREYGQDAVHDKLAFEGAEEVLIKEPGYVYIYLSNENETAVEVFFDDFKVEHKKSPVIQMDDYYPFGLTFNSYERENSMKNRFLFNSMEHDEELDLGWDVTLYRVYQPDIGRWRQIDPKSSERESPYVGFGNNPIKFSDAMGDTIKYEGRKEKVDEIKSVDEIISNKSRLGRRIIKRLRESKNVHYVQETPRPDTPEGKEMIMAAYARYEKGEISETEYMQNILTWSGSVLTESDKENFKNNNDDDKRDTDGTGTGTTLYVAVEGAKRLGLWDDLTSIHNKISLLAHEHGHQYNADRGKIDNRKTGTGVAREENRATRIARRIVRQVSRNTGQKINVQKRY
jgi:RHS repeat-associated protein